MSARLAALEKAVDPSARGPAALTWLLREVAHYYEVPYTALWGRSRVRRLVWLRALTVYLARRYTPSSYPQIGRAIGRDHTSALHLFGKYQKELERNEALRAHTLEVVTALELEET